MSHITQAEIKQLFEYGNGQLIWKIQANNNGAPIGTPAGHIMQNGYVLVGISRRQYLAHRLIFLMHHGYLPAKIDHLDGNRQNNKIDNLRPANSQQNSANSRKVGKFSSKWKGVTWDRARGKWAASVGVNRKRIALGRFDDEGDAAMAYNEAAVFHFGAYAQLNEAYQPLFN